MRLPVPDIGDFHNKQKARPTPARAAFRRNSCFDAYKTETLREEPFRENRLLPSGQQPRPAQGKRAGTALGAGPP